MQQYFIRLLLSLFFVLCLFSSAFSEGTSIAGKWKTFDDETNEPKSIVNIFEKDGKYFGQIVELLRKEGEDPNPICDDCADDDPRKNQPIRGMVIIQDLVQDGDKYKGGTILDPENGKVYNCKLWIEDGKLMVRGYIGFFFRTQTWHMAE